MIKAIKYKFVPGRVGVEFLNPRCVYFGKIGTVARDELERRFWLKVRIDGKIRIASRESLKVVENV